MSLQKKIILGFLISAGIIALLAGFAYVSFIEIRKEIRFLELSDTLRSKTLQLRRHEKNFLLYGDDKELDLVHSYLKEIDEILTANLSGGSGQMKSLKNNVDDYRSLFSGIVRNHWMVISDIEILKMRHPAKGDFFPIVESTFLERPLVNAEFLISVFGIPETDRTILTLRALHDQISSLRRVGEEILTLSKDLDRDARNKVDTTIGFVRIAALVLLPLFLLVGITGLFLITRNAIKRLNRLSIALAKTGEGDFSELPSPQRHDEVGLLIDSFNRMEQNLIARDHEIAKKNEELLQSRKLASIGTLASGVAHELNNPLNNIYLAAQILQKEIGGQDVPGIVKETVGDIFSQTLRVKRIVGDLLEFSREKPPALVRTDLLPVIDTVIGQLRVTGELSGIHVVIDMHEDIAVPADRHLLEQAFINLAGNAADAMNGQGTLTLAASARDGSVRITVSDTGQGIPPDNIGRIFDPFFTTKEKGTGLGLAIVYNIVRKHNGKIDVASVPGQGTTFTITLPEA
ncbi:MAG: hypothetical protein OHK006_01520 [Thermodesulfovibrionales bacterium]